MSEDKGVMWTLNVFDGDPPEPHQHWHEWLEASQKCGVYTGVAIRSVAHHYILSMLAESQAAEIARLKEENDFLHIELGKWAAKWQICADRLDAKDKS